MSYILFHFVLLVSFEIIWLYRNPIKMTFNTLNPKSKRLKIQKSKSLLSDLPLLLFLASSFFISITFFTIFLLLAFQPKKKKKKWQETIQMNFHIYSKNVTPGGKEPEKLCFFSYQIFISLSSVFFAAAASLHEYLFPLENWKKKNNCGQYFFICCWHQRHLNWFSKENAKPINDKAFPRFIQNTQSSWIFFNLEILLSQCCIEFTSVFTQQQNFTKLLAL